jgi:hypothetical protein
MGAYIVGKPEIQNGFISLKRKIFDPFSLYRFTGDRDRVENLFGLY